MGSRKAVNAQEHSAADDADNIPPVRDTLLPIGYRQQTSG
jgi:hypothetical protein